ncbi:MAG: bifunctional hydroxymethylpyrimidine kinase/phosphomethylpyrimidine kinase [Solirubrobacteraceae bacterium]|nr:bifunctional hydroxymethylpyrimidine kinase/phosphomethylpyrimidine kinase [Solirubrobacteraceae bacterium]
MNLSGAPAPRPQVAILGPHPVLAVNIEPYPGGADEIHFHPGGQGVWVARMAAALGADPILCGFLGGETGQLLEPLLAGMPGERRFVRTAADSGSFIMDRRGGSYERVAQAFGTPPGRHEVDALVSATIAAALRCGLLVLCNPLPGDALSEEFYERIVADVRGHGVRVLADLSSPRLNAALRGGLDLVKINDWELAEYVSGPVEDPHDLARAASRIMADGSQAVIITRGERSAMVFRGEDRWELTAPSFSHGFREGCGDSMMGAMAAILATGGEWDHALRIGAAAGAVNFLRCGLGSADPDVVRELAPSVQLELLPRLDPAAR